MPLIHERTFHVRYGECDALGHVNNAHYLRYMQEAAFDGSAAAGYGIERYAAMHRLWVARQTEIEYLRPLRYGDSVIVKTWIQDFRKVTSRRNYEMRNAATDEPVANAYTEWAFIDSTTGRPAVIPVEAVSAYFPEGAPAPAPARERFPVAPPAPAGVVKVRRTVTWDEIDAAWYVNNPVYLTYAEDCGFSAIAAHGWPITRMIDEGCAIVVRKNQVEYLQAAVLNDEIEIATWISDVRRVSARRHYVITRVNDGVVLARIHSLGVWVNLDTGAPTKFPAQFVADFAPNTSI
ncbi:MAG TPA: acyl-CoA thioesterase [Anaerolineae bacterium]